MSSCREILPFEQEQQVAGYRLNGTVTTQNGIPLDSVSVSVSYTYEFVDSNPRDTATIMITDTTKTVFVAVFTTANEYVAQLYFGFRHPGPLPRYLWNGRGELGAPVPSGKYIIRYVYGDTVVKEVVAIAEGNETARTDQAGDFQLSGDRLPVGELVDLYDTDGTPDGLFRVADVLNLTFAKGGRVSRSSVGLERDAVTRRVFVLR